MTERKNLKLDEETFNRLKEHKEKHENWNHAVNRLLDEAGDD